MRRRVAFTCIMLFLMTAVTLVFFELAVRLVYPQAEFFPRYRYSERYGHTLPESSTLVSQMPGSWRFVYNTNEYGYRMSMPQISNRYDRPNIVFLGDSNTFGIGVNDGEEYPAVLAKRLTPNGDTVNLGVGGFGLTHEIRTFYEFGVLFQPAVVVLQFGDNDPDENFYEMVTIIEDGRFRFPRTRSMDRTMGSVKDWLGSSIIQRSAAYNVVRNYAFKMWLVRAVERETAADARRKEVFYNELLTAFAKDLRRRDVPLVFFDVPGNLARWPGILTHVKSLDREGLLHYLPTDRWFMGVTGYDTPEGHAWGVKGHRIVAEHLVEPLRALLEGANPASSQR